jgi:hypothetical protein
MLKIYKLNLKIMKTIVKIIAHPETGEIFTKKLNSDNSPKLDKNGKEYGQLRVDSQELSLGFSYTRGAIKRRTAFIPMTVEAWDKSKEFITVGTVVPGKIVRSESRIPQYAGQQPKKNPTSGEDVLVNGSKVYFQDTYTEDMSATDVLIKATVSVNSEVEANEIVLN